MQVDVGAVLAIKNQLHQLILQHRHGHIECGGHPVHVRQAV